MNFVKYPMKPIKNFKFSLINVPKNNNCKLKNVNHNQVTVSGCQTAAHAQSLQNHVMFEFWFVFVFGLTILFSWISITWLKDANVAESTESCNTINTFIYINMWDV